MMSDHVQMGLGKTLQAISLLSYLKIKSIAPGPFRAYLV
jgi:SNF2 family DNA or RNA helicase